MNKSKKNKKPILSLTKSAIIKIQLMMVKEKKQGYGLHIGVIIGGCSGLSYDLQFQKNPFDNDIVIKQDDLKIFINSESIEFLEGTEIHYVDTLKESGFKYKNPNASNNCGCGISFS